MNAMTETIRILMVKCGDISIAELGRRMGMTSQNFHRKMRNGNYDVDDLENIAKILNCKLNISFTLDNGEGETLHYKGSQ